MGIFDRLGNVIKSYLNDEDRRMGDSLGGGRGRGYGRGDPDMEAAFEELNEYLNGRRSEGDGGRRDDRTFGENGPSGAVPESLRPDFAELGVPFGASAAECKAAYKKLLKIHHPDRHANHPGNFKRATEKSARINASYDRIAAWRS
jgi:DnaJ-domain-containing protein 1